MRWELVLTSSSEKKSILKEYLDVFVIDGEAWEELASLYISNQMLKQAAFCYEEIILLAPSDPYCHIK